MPDLSYDLKTVSVDEDGGIPFPLGLSEDMDELKVSRLIFLPRFGFTFPVQYHRLLRAE